MRNYVETQTWLQQAYDIDIGKQKGNLDVHTLIESLGVMAFHIGYYDSGLAQLPEIREHIRLFPQGQFARLITGIRNARLVDYPVEVLNKMYGLD